MSDDPLSNLPAIIAGHSHIVAMGVPLRSADDVSCSVPLSVSDSRFVGLTGKWDRDQSYFDALIRSSPGQTIILSWMGNQYDAAFRIARDPPVDFVLSEEPDLPLQARATLVPEAIIWERLSEGDSGLSYLVDEVLKQSPRRVVLCGSPPPKNGYRNLKSEVKSFSSFWGLVSQQIGVDFQSFELAPTQFLLKTWKVLQRKYALFAKEKGIDFLPSPRECHTEDGFLKERYWGDDYSHANALYGAVIREKAWEMIGK